ncbi:MAG: DUF459 domain-containing protein [Acidimicrobiales bacterium]
MLVALGVAALVNADSLVERAEREPLGESRDRSLAIWHPVQDLSHIVQAYRWRQLGGWAVGGEPDDSSATSATVAADVPASPPRPELRPPTGETPLRVWVGGDSMMRDLGESFARRAAGIPTLDTTVHVEISTGLTRPDYFDWPAALAADLEATDAELLVVMFGANDAQGLVLDDGTQVQSVADRAWQAEYARRVEAVMDQLYAEDRLVLWVGQPPMRDRRFSDRMTILNRIFQGAASDRSWVEYVDTTERFGDDPAGDLRQVDGIHFSRAGADLLADDLLGLIGREVQLE